MVICVCGWKCQKEFEACQPFTDAVLKILTCGFRPYDPFSVLKKILTVQGR